MSCLDSLDVLADEGVLCWISLGDTSLLSDLVREDEETLLSLSFVPPNPEETLLSLPFVSPNPEETLLSLPFVSPNPGTEGGSGHRPDIGSSVTIILDLDYAPTF